MRNTIRFVPLVAILALVLAFGAVALTPAQVAFAAEPTPDPSPTPGTPISGDGVVPLEYDGNVDCQQLGLGSVFGFKIEGNGAAVYTGTFPLDRSKGGIATGGAPLDPFNSVTLSSTDGFYVNWAATLGIDAVIVKGGKDSNAYVYVPEDNADTKLASPDLKSGERPQISHVELCYDYELSATKTANTSYTRTYSWSIDKSVDPVAHAGFAGAKFSSSYKVSVDQTVTDSDFAVAGTITVKNQTPYAVNFSVTDSVNGTPATVTCDALSLAPGASTNCTYSAALGSTNPGPGTNTATITSSTAGVKGTTATAPYSFDKPTTVVGYPTINVTDSKQGVLGSASGDTTFPYSRPFGCPTDATKYVGGLYTEEVPNTATIVESGQQDGATVTVTCYAPVVSKDAAATYDEVHSWSIAKSVNPENQSGIVGDKLPWTWKVDVSESFVEGNFSVRGAISVYNPAPIAMTVDVADQLNDGTDATVDCGSGSPSLIIPAGETRSCSYTASPTDRTATGNIAIATINQVGFSAKVPLTFVKNVINGTATVKDLTIGLDESLTAGLGPWEYTGSGSHICSNDPKAYNAQGNYSGSVSNTATLVDAKENTSTAGATTTYTCFAPVVTKDAKTIYDETHTWSITKSVTPPSQSGFPGQKLSWTWTVGVSESSVNTFAVSGSIKVANPAFKPMTVKVSDVLDDGTVATVDCGGGSDSLTVAGGQVGTCSYTALPKDASATKNTATATINGASFTGEVDVTFVKNVIGGTATVTDKQIGLNKELEAGNGPWAFSESFSHTCSANASDYVGDGMYGQTLDNLATLTPSNSKSLESSASTTYTCYAPLVSKTADPSFTRTWSWTIDKSGDQTELKLTVGQSFVVNYDVFVNASSADGNYLVKGIITVKNPADKPMTVDVADKLNDSTPATVDCGGGSTSLTVAGGETGMCTYTAAPGGPTATLNTATATLNGAAFTGEAVVDFAKAAISQVDDCISVTDDKAGALGAACATETLPKQFSYSLTVGPFATCGAYEHANTASFATDDSKTSGSDTWTIPVNVPCQGCTLTQGYWKTHSKYGPARYDDAWALVLPQGEDSPFFSSGKIWYGVLWTPPAGNVYYNLAHQYIAAKLNVLNGAATTPAVTAAITWAEKSFFTLYSPSSTLSKTVRAQALSYASTLDKYNNGYTGPGHCSEDLVPLRIDEIETTPILFLPSLNK